MSETRCGCGHSDRMHVTGVSPRYAGCMVVVAMPTEHRRRRFCSCSLAPAQVRSEAVVPVEEPEQPEAVK